MDMAVKGKAIPWKKWIKDGSRIFVGSGAACPNPLMHDMLSHSDEFSDLEFVHILTLGDSPWISEATCNRFRVNAFFLGPQSRDMVSKGLSDYTPCFLSEIPGLFLDYTLPLDVAIICVSPPDSHGYCSMGVSVDVVSSAVRSAKYVIAQVNPQMPRTMGQGFIHINEIDDYMEIDSPLPELARPELDPVTLKIGKYVSLLIEDGATLQMGIGKIPDAVLSNLHNHKNLGIHTEMFSDGVLELYEKGVINNSQKAINQNKTITSFCIGSRKLYDFVHNNPHIQFHPSEYVNSPLVIAQNHKMVAINSAIEVDLTGQVVSDSVGYKFYSGIGGQVDFIRGAAQCPNGIPIIALPSTTKNDSISKIVPHITEGSGVVTSRGDIHYVVTEYGIATLRGRSIRERALELIQVAHPKFRDELLHQVRKTFWVPSYHESKVSHIKELGQVDVIKYEHGDHSFLLRALRPSDERKLQEFFYSHNEETVFQRYRSIKKQMTRESAYKLVNVDQNKDLALCVIERQGPREIIHGVGRYYLEEDKNEAEVAVIVRETHRRRGIASFLLKNLLVVAKERNIQRITAIARADNYAMNKVFNKFGFIKSESEDIMEKNFMLNVLEASLN